VVDTSFCDVSVDYGIDHVALIAYRCMGGCCVSDMMEGAASACLRECVWLQAKVELSVTEISWARDHKAVCVIFARLSRTARRAEQ
jgi:hypothetical protein